MSEQDAVVYAYQNTGVEAVSNREATTYAYDNVGFESIQSRDGVVSVYENCGFGFFGIPVPVRTSSWGAMLTESGEDNVIAAASISTTYTYEGDVT